MQVLDGLVGDVAALQARWDGEAREAFAVAMRDANASLRRLRKLASGAAAEAGTTIGALQEFDRRRQSAWPA